MSKECQRTREAVQKAYSRVLGGEAACDNVAFEAAVMVYRRLHPDVPEPEARDIASQFIADAAYRTALEWIEEAGGPDAIQAQGKPTPETTS
jgi:hypothetical protein